MLVLWISKDRALNVDSSTLHQQFKDLGLLNWPSSIARPEYERTKYNILFLTAYKRVLSSILLQEDLDPTLHVSQVKFLSGGPAELTLCKLGLPHGIRIQRAIHIPQGKRVLRKACRVIAICEPDCSPHIRVKRMREYRRWIKGCVVKRLI